MLSCLRPALALMILAPLLGNQAKAQDDPGCEYLQTVKLPVRYAGPNLSPTVEGKINDTPATMLVDTGAPMTLMTRQGAERRGLPLHATDKRAFGVGGVSRLYAVRVAHFALGPVSQDGTELPVAGDIGAAVEPFDAILGAPFLLQADLEISLADKQLALFKPKGCDDAFLAYWDPAAEVVPFAQSSSANRNPRFSIELNGVELTAMIDSGAQLTVVSQPAAQRAGIDMASAGVKDLVRISGVGTDSVRVRSAMFDTVRIGTRTFRNAEIGIIDGSAKLADVLLGQDFLRAHRVLIAMSQRKLYLSYLGGKVFYSGGLDPWVRHEAEAGNADAQFVLAHAYATGKGIARDGAQVALWLHKAAAQGHAHARATIDALEARRPTATAR